MPRCHQPLLGVQGTPLICALRVSLRLLDLSYVTCDSRPTRSSVVFSFPSISSCLLLDSLNGFGTPLINLEVPCHDKWKWIICGFRIHKNLHEYILTCPSFFFFRLRQRAHVTDFLIWDFAWGFPAPKRRVITLVVNRPRVHTCQHVNHRMRVRLPLGDKYFVIIYHINIEQQVRSGKMVISASEQLINNNSFQSSVY